MRTISKLYAWGQITLATIVAGCAISGVVYHGFITDHIHGLGWIIAAMAVYIPSWMWKLSLMELKQTYAR